MSAVVSGRRSPRLQPIKGCSANSAATVRVLPSPGVAPDGMDAKQAFAAHAHEIFGRVQISLLTLVTAWHVHYFIATGTAGPQALVVGLCVGHLGCKLLIRRIESYLKQAQLGVLLMLAHFVLHSISRAFSNITNAAAGLLYGNVQFYCDNSGTASLYMVMLGFGSALTLVGLSNLYKAIFVCIFEVSGSLLWYQSYVLCGNPCILHAGVTSVVAFFVGYLASYVTLSAFQADHYSRMKLVQSLEQQAQEDRDTIGWLTQERRSVLIERARAQVEAEVKKAA